MIEKIAKRLKRFSLAELEIIADRDCFVEIQKLLDSGSLKKSGEFYEYIENKNENFIIVVSKSAEPRLISITTASEIFLRDYVKPRCKTWTLKTYISIFKTNILPYFKEQNLAELSLDDILAFYDWLKSKNLSDLRTKNTMALLNQLFHYFQNLGIIDKRCDFKVQRIESKKSKLKNMI